ncbi:MAG: hypothetical protein K1X94_30815 [Sandaracinaceae bacterium]|nr:hypothetical protein [Sandaracinaceae bacterium]
MSTTSWKLTAAGLGVMALTGLAGCGSDGIAQQQDLEYVDSSIATRTDLFLDPTLDNRPMTLAQLGGERASAIPIQVEVFDSVAAAWRRSADGTVLPRNADNLVAVWEVYDVRDGNGIQGAQAVDRELEGGIDYQPGDVDLPTVDGVDIERPGDRLARENPGENLYVLVDWIDRFSFLNDRDYELARELNERHPGCL